MVKFVHTAAAIKGNCLDELQRRDAFPWLCIECASNVHRLCIDCA